MQQPESSAPGYVVLGKIIGFFGVRGWVKVHSDTDPRENIVNYSQWWLGSPESRTPIKVRSGKRSGKNVVAQLAGIESREQAASLLGQDIAVLRSMLPELHSNEIYWTDLIGCAVEDVQGGFIGSVDRLFETGANDVMVVNDERSVDQQSGDRKSSDEILIPWIRPSVITNIDLSTRTIVVDWDPDF